MKRTIVTSAVLALALLAVPLHVVGGPARGSTAQAARLVRVGLKDGSSKIVRFDGVGCNESICSRVAVNSRTVGDVIANRTRFDDIAAIQEICDDTALFVFKDGTKRRVSVVPDNRVLYVIGADGNTQKISLAGVLSIDFNPSNSK
jgi:hypothetical protein